MGRSYLVDSAGELTLVDTSTGGCADAILHAIEKLGRKPTDLRTIITSHYHFDHTGNADALRERTGARILAHAYDTPYIDGRQPWGTGRQPTAWERLGEGMMAPKPYALTVDAMVRDGEVLPGNLRIIHTPGHTPGHVSVYDESRRILFAADAFMNVFGLRLPLGGSTHDMDQARRSVEALSRLDIDHALPGHGQPILSHAGEKLRLWVARWLH
jgi:glyoxylase-like metal-dependent hydrolase (beta-lactamase superfamily II)